MANAVAVDTWSAQGVRLGDVVSALSVLRDQSSTRSSSTRTAVMTLIAVAPTDEQAYAATNALRALSGHHPARIVIVRPDPDQVAALDARATLYAMETEGHHINFDEVTLDVKGQAANHLDSVVEAFTLSDLPVAVWYVGSVPDPTDPLLNVAKAVLLDSRDAAGAGLLRGLLELARRRTIVDLSWIRLGPWRELLAGLFDPVDSRVWLSSVQHAEVSGKVGPRTLLGGWVAGQLGLTPKQVSLTDARHVEIRVTCGTDGKEATFDVQRGDQHRTVAARSRLPGGGGLTHTMALADDPLPTALATALTHLEADVIWEKALSAATALAV